MPTDTADPGAVMKAAESLELTATSPRQDADAATRTARSARDQDGLLLLLNALDLPRGEDEIARLLPFSTTSAGTAPGRPDTPCGGNPVSSTAATPTAEHAPAPATPDPMSREVALSMRARGDSPLKILAATGLTEDDLQQLAAEHPGAADPSPYGAVDELLVWGHRHAQPRIRRLAEQARQALDTLHAQHATDRAVAAHEAEVAALKARLQQAEQALRDAKSAKSGKPATATARPAGTAAGAELAQPADKAVRTAIRAWAAGQGRQVADRGVISQDVLRAWYAAHPGTLAQAG